MSKKRIPKEIKEQADKIVADFNQNVIANPSVYYMTPTEVVFCILNALIMVGQGQYAA